MARLEASLQRRGGGIFSGVLNIKGLASGAAGGNMGIGISLKAVENASGDAGLRFLGLAVNWGGIGSTGHDGRGFGVIIVLLHG